MGYLDDLKKKSETLKADEQADKERKERLEAFYEEEIIPKLEAIYTYLYEMAEHLNYVKPEVRVRYGLVGYGEMSDLLQSDYIIKTDSRKSMKNIMLSFYCVGEDDFSFTVDGKDNINREKEYLGRTSLDFTCKERRDSNHELVDASFTVKSKVPVSFEFSADIENSAIQVSIRNFEDFVANKAVLKPDAISSDFLDKLARYIVREEDGLFQADIPTDAKAILQEKLREEKKQREEELRLAEQQELEEQQQRKQNSMLGRLKRLGKRS